MIRPGGGGTPCAAARSHFRDRPNAALLRGVFFWGLPRRLARGFHPFPIDLSLE